MHHPFHLHGADRFLVLARDGVPESNLVWKDTVLVRTGQTVDILFDVTEPGLWMAHCHIAEHLQSGMMFSFTVARRRARPFLGGRPRASPRRHRPAHDSAAGQTLSPGDAGEPVTAVYRNVRLSSWLVRICLGSDRHRKQSSQAHR